MISKIGIILFILFVAAFGLSGLASPDTKSDAAPTSTVKYKEGKELNFDQLVIEGQMRRPELSVVTGDDDEGTNGLLKLREDFVDKMTVDAGEQIP